MADAIPNADAGLLAAQARSGQAGVDAYKAAQAELTKQRGDAVQRAMQEAAMRGSPAGAMQSQAGIIAQPYDDRIASLQQGGAAFQADMAARDHRMADYNQAILSARSYIPEQVQMSVAPIVAQGRAQVANTQRQGEMQVSEIEGNLRLTTAKMAAAAQAAEIAAAKQAAKDAKDAAKIPKLTGTDLESMLSTGAQERLGATAQMLSAAVERNQTAATPAAVKGVLTDAGINKANDEAARNASTNDLSAARYIGQGLQDMQKPGTLANKLAAKSFAGIINTPFGSFTPPKAGQAQSGVAGGLSGAFGAFGPKQPTAEDAKQAATEKLRQSQAAEHELQMQAAARSAAVDQRRRKALSDAVQPFRSQYGWVTNDEVAGFDPTAQSAITNAPAPFNNQDAINKYLIGEPGQYGLSDPYSTQVFGDTTGAVADDLLQSGQWDFTKPDYLNAVDSPGLLGQNIYNLRQKAAGQPTGEEQWKLATDEQKAATAADRQQILDERSDTSWLQSQATWAQTHDPDTGAPLGTAPDPQKQADADALARFQQAYKVDPPTNLSPQVAYSIAASDQFKAGEAAILQANKGAGISSDDLVEILDQAGIQDAATRRLLAYIYKGIGTP